jgi:hypothetical protein
MEVKGKTWTRVADNQIIHIWVRAEDDDCIDGEDSISVSPDWYEENGTPICPFCGSDMVYDHTEILA